MQQKKHRVRLILKSKDDQLLHKLVRNYLDETKQVVEHQGMENATRILIVECTPDVAALRMNQLNPNFNFFFA